MGDAVFKLAHTDGEPFSAVGTIVGKVFGVHGEPRVRVSHLPTGGSIGEFENVALALKFAETLALDPVWRSKQWKFGKRPSLKSKLYLAAQASVKRALEATK